MHRECLSDESMSSLFIFIIGIHLANKLSRANSSIVMCLFRVFRNRVFRTGVLPRKAARRPPRLPPADVSHGDKPDVTARCAYHPNESSASLGQLQRSQGTVPPE